MNISDKKKSELAYINKRIDIIFEFMLSHPSDATLSQMDKDYVDKWQRQNLKYLRILERSLYEGFVLMHMSSPLQEKLEQKLRDGGVYERPWRKARKLAGPRLTEADNIKRKFELFSQFMQNVEYHKDSAQRDLLKVRYLHSMGDLPGLRSMNSELRQLMREGMRADYKEKLEILFEKYSGEKQGSYDAEWEKKVQAMVEKGKIENIKQYKLANDWVEANYQDALKLPLIEKINLLLAAFHRRDMAEYRHKRRRT